MRNRERTPIPRNTLPSIIAKSKLLKAVKQVLIVVKYKKDSEVDFKI